MLTVRARAFEVTVGTVPVLSIIHLRYFISNFKVFLINLNSTNE